jgi:hypothetical protein
VAQDLVSLYNLALDAAGTKAKISSPTEVSREASVCNRWYEPVRNQILRGAPWQSCRNTALLALQAERDFDLDWADGDPEPPWTYRYALPSDFLYPRYLDSFQPFVLGDKDGSPVLFTHEPTATLIHTKKQTVPPAWDADLYWAIIHGLAAYIVMPLSGKTSRANSEMQLANLAMIQARVNTANENTVEYDSMPDWLIARGAVTTTTPSRFIYQNGPLLSLNGAF